MTEGKTVYIRITPESRAAVRIYGAEEQRKTGEQLSDAESLKRLFAEYLPPELLQDAKNLVRRQQEGSDNE